MPPSLEAFACLAVVEAQLEKAMRLAGGAAALRDAMGAPISPTDSAMLDRWLGPARRALGEAATGTEWAAGRRVPLQQLVVDALTPAPRRVPPPRRNADAFALTPREQQVADLLAQGRTNRQIAEALVIGLRPAVRHVRAVLGKLGVERRAEVAVRAASRTPTDRPDPD